MAEEICQFFEQLKTLVHQAERRNTSDKVELNDLRVKIGIGIATVADLLDNVESTASKMQIRSLMDCLELILLEIVRELAGNNTSVAFIDYSPGIGIFHRTWKTKMLHCRSLQCCVCRGGQ